MKKEVKKILAAQDKLRVFKHETPTHMLKLKKNYVLPVEVRLKLILKKDGFKIYSVDGEKIRQFIDVDFIMGGHGMRYVYVPFDEIWIDSCNLPELHPILEHEIFEFNLMKNGKDYNESHDASCIIEYLIRTKKVILPVNHFLQNKNYNCGPSALKIVLDYYGDKKSINELTRGTNCNHNGTIHSGFTNYLKKLNYNFLSQDNSSLKDIEDLIKKGIPVIVDYQDHHFGTGGHYSVIIGFDENRLLLSNPSLKRKYEWLNKQDFLKDWHEEDEPGKIVKRWLLAIYRKN